MKAASIREIKTELQLQTHDELVNLCLSLAKFKKESKELLTYLLYEASDEASFVESVKEDITLQFEEVNVGNYHWMKKGARKILRNVKKHIRFSKNKQTEIALLLHFCFEMRQLNPSIKGSITLYNIYFRQVAMIRKIIPKLHPDLQHDYEIELEEMESR